MQLEDIVVLTLIKTLIQNRIDVELDNIMEVCIQAGKDIDALIEEALKF